MALYQHNYSYFDITDYKSKLPVVIQSDVISLSITEEMGKMDRGSLQLLDRNSDYSTILAPFTTFNVEFGIKNMRYGSILPRRLNMYAYNPSGSGDNNGRITFNCNLVGAGQETDWKPKVYENKSAFEIVKDVFEDEFGLTMADYRISARLTSIRFTDAYLCNKAENGFKFLTLRAADWGCYFRMGYSNGKLKAFFVYPEDLETVAFGLTSIYGSRFLYGYRDILDRAKDITAETPLRPSGKGVSNVISYDWKRNGMDGNVGDGVTIRMLQGGQIVLERYQVDTQKTVIYKLNTEKANNRYKMEANIENKINFALTALTKWKWEEAKNFFIEEVETTAPQGQGYRVNCHLMGDPTLTAGSTVAFGYGFPSSMQVLDRRWWIQKATHTFSSSGYYTDVEVIDQYIFDPTGNVSPMTQLLATQDNL